MRDNSYIHNRHTTHTHTQRTTHQNTHAHTHTKNRTQTQTLIISNCRPTHNITQQYSLKRTITSSFHPPIALFFSFFYHDNSPGWMDILVKKRKIVPPTHMWTSYSSHLSPLFLCCTLHRIPNTNWNVRMLFWFLPRPPPLPPPLVPPLPIDDWLSGVEGRE